MITCDYSPAHVCQVSRFYAAYGGLKLMLCPKGKDLANECLTQFLEGAYLCTQRIQCPESVSVLCFLTKTFSIASSDKLWGMVGHSR